MDLGSDGEVKIASADRSDFIKTSGGKPVSPQPIEVKPKASPLLDEAVVVGGGPQAPRCCWPSTRMRKGHEPRGPRQGTASMDRRKLIPNSPDRSRSRTTGSVSTTTARPKPVS